MKSAFHRLQEKAAQTVVDFMNSQDGMPRTKPVRAEVERLEKLWSDFWALNGGAPLPHLKKNWRSLDGGIYKICLPSWFESDFNEVFSAIVTAFTWFAFAKVKRCANCATWFWTLRGTGKYCDESACKQAQFRARQPLTQNQKWDLARHWAIEKLGLYQKQAATGDTEALRKAYLQSESLRMHDFVRKFRLKWKATNDPDDRAHLKETTGANLQEIVMPPETREKIISRLQAIWKNSASGDASAILRRPRKTHNIFANEPLSRIGSNETHFYWTPERLRELESQWPAFVAEHCPDVKLRCEPCDHHACRVLDGPCITKSDSVELVFVDAGKLGWLQECAGSGKFKGSSGTPDRNGDDLAFVGKNLGLSLKKRTLQKTHFKSRVPMSIDDGRTERVSVAWVTFKNTCLKRCDPCIVDACPRIDAL